MRELPKIKPTGKKTHWNGHYECERTLARSHKMFFFSLLVNLLIGLLVGWLSHVIVHAFPAYTHARARYFNRCAQEFRRFFSLLLNLCECAHLFFIRESLLMYGSLFFFHSADIHVERLFHVWLYAFYFQSSRQIIWKAGGCYKRKYWRRRRRRQQQCRWQ